jgi:hypothetical protein
LQKELKAARPDLNIEILGVNRPGEEYYNSLMTSGRTLPWLQDTRVDPVWRQWRTAYRDVRILDSQNRVHATYNLSLHDLTLEANRTALKELFLAAAQATDADADGLLDDWEIRHFTNLEARPSEDPDSDGADNLTEFAFGGDPHDSASRGDATLFVRSGSTERAFTLVLRRRAGWMYDFPVEFSPDLLGWSSGPATPFGEPTVSRNLFDGNGLIEELYSFNPAQLKVSTGFIRIRPQAR